MQILIQKQCHDLLLFRDQNNNETNRLVTQNARTFYGRRTNVTGEGIFTFYSEDAKRILSKYEELCCRGSIEVTVMLWLLFLLLMLLSLMNDNANEKTGWGLLALFNQQGRLVVEDKEELSRCGEHLVEEEPSVLSLQAGELVFHNWQGANLCIMLYFFF